MLASKRSPSILVPIGLLAVFLTRDILFARVFLRKDEKRKQKP